MPRGSRAGAALAALATAATMAGLAGCGGFTLAARPTSRVASRKAAGSAVTRAEVTHELPTPARPETAHGARSAAAAIDRFAELYINWTAADVAGRMSQLAGDSVGQARSEMALAAAETAGDSTLEQGGIDNRGTVEAVAPRLAHPDQYVVVTLESTVASNTAAYQGLAPAWHLTIATVVAARGGGWVISGWQPET